MIDVMIISFNEALNLPHCLRALAGWPGRVFVIDSGSTDGTPDLARRMGAEVVHHAWEGYARQKNWGLRNLPFESEWILILDSDEALTDSVKMRLFEIASRPAASVPENGFYINRLTYFMDRPIRHCGYFPSWNMRFFKRGRGFYEDREVHEHIIIDAPVGYISEAMIHNDRRGLEHFVAKHNRYSTLEARTLFNDMAGRTKKQDVHLTRQAKFRRMLKRYVTPHVPFAGMWRFLYVYVFRLGVLDGRVGLEFCKFIAMYDGMVAMKLRALRRQAKRGESTDLVDRRVQGLATAEGDDAVLPADLRDRVETAAIGGVNGALEGDPAAAVAPRRQPVAMLKRLPAEAPPPDSPAARFGSLVDRSKRVVITGGSGFIGTNLIEFYWRAGAEVVNLDIAPPRDPAHGHLWREVDIRRRDDVIRAMAEIQPAIVHHLAARTDLEERKDLAGYGANMEGVANTIEAIERAGSVDRVIFTSSQLVCRPGYDPRDDHDYSPHTLYGMSKVITESVIRGWAQSRGRDANARRLPWVIVRPTSIWGPWFDVPYRTFFDMIQRGLYRHQRGFNPRRSFGFVGNAVYQFAKLAAVPAEAIDGRTLYMSDYAPIRVRDWADLIQQEMGVKRLKETSYGVLKSAARAGDALGRLGVSFPMTSFRLTNLTSDNVSDLRPTETACGPLPYSVEEGVRVTVRWMKGAAAWGEQPATRSQAVSTLV
jgi:nucleoside-diphosphate-sugar epimerase/glycosyltransferase involved in cell wall biosynthesis